MNKLKYNILFIIGFFLITSCENSSTNNANGARQLTVDVISLEHESVKNIILLPGNVLPFEQVTLYTEVAGRVSKIYFNEGDEVKVNTPLLKIDSDILEAKKAEIETNLKFAKKEESRTKNLYEAKAGSFEAYELAQGKVASLEAELKSIAVEIDKTTLRAPFSGQVGLRMISPGAFIGTNDPIANMAQQNPLKIEFSVSQRYANKVKAGQSIVVKDKNGNTIGKAEVYAFDPIIDNASRSLKIRARIENNEHLFPGSFVQVEYDLGEIEDGFMVPSSAVSPVLNGQQIWLLKDGKATSKIVELGIRTSDQVQIIGNISEGDTLITTGLLSMREGLELKGKVNTK
jgi:membrane fusion protein (multidrug efflux system)